MRARRTAALAVCLASATLVGSLSGAARSAPAPAGAVKGLHQAFQAATYVGMADLEAAAQGSVRYLAGTAPSAGLDRATPLGRVGAQQVTTAVGDEDVAGDPGVASWRGDVGRMADGALELTWWWSSPTPTFNDETVLVAVIAGVGTPRERVVARTEAVVQAGANPVRNVTRVPVHTTVEGPVVIQTRPSPTSDSPTLVVHYGSATTPSSAAYRATAAPYDSGKQHNVAARYAGPKLEVQAAYIGRDAAEPTVGVDQDGVAYMAAGAFDALPPNPITNAARTEIKRSDDGGKSWETVQLTLPADLTTVPPTTLDPYVYVDEITGRVFTPDLYLACNYLQFSDDKGETWTQSPVACGQGVNDHQTVVTGPPPEGEQSLGIYPNYVYYCFNRVADASCGRSLDGGITWLPAGQPAFLGVNGDRELCGGLHGHIVTDNQGRLYLPKGHCDYPWLAISEDGAQTWRTVQVNDTFQTAPLSAGSHTAVDVDADGNIYYLWTDEEARLPLLSVSKDAGETWSKPLLVAPPGLEEVNFPTIDAGKAGQIAISFPGTRFDRDDPDVDVTTRAWNYYVMTSLNADAEHPLFVSTTAQPVSDPIHRGNCGPGRCGGMFDFIDVEFAPNGEIWAAATDTCTEVEECNTPAGTRSASALGLAIRQLSGPGLTGAAPVPVTPPKAPPGPVAPRPVPPTPLPATGASDVLLWLGLASAGAALAMARLRRGSARAH